MNTKIPLLAGKWAAIAGAVLVLLVLEGCATGYQAASLTGGYREKRITADTYEVVFSGNGHTSKAMVERYFLYRCAELTKEQGFKYFAILRTRPTSLREEPLREAELGRPAARLYRASLDPRDGGGEGFYKVRGGGGGAHYYYVPGGGSYYITTYTGRATIRMFNDDTLPGRVVGYPVAQVMDTISPFIKNQQVAVMLPRPSLLDPVLGVMPLPERPVPPAANAVPPGPSPAAPAGGNPGAPPDGSAPPPPPNDKAT
jgi:hypothetical protein